MSESKLGLRNPPQYLEVTEPTPGPAPLRPQEAEEAAMWMKSKVHVASWPAVAPRSRAGSMTVREKDKGSAHGKYWMQQKPAS